MLAVFEDAAPWNHEGNFLSKQLNSGKNSTEDDKLDDRWMLHSRKFAQTKISF